MSSSLEKKDIQELRILKLLVDEKFLTAEINDQRVISIPLSWFDRLMSASQEQLHNFEISPSGYGIHWPDLDEDISIQAFINPT